MNKRYFIIKSILINKIIYFHTTNVNSILINISHTIGTMGEDDNGDNIPNIASFYSIDNDLVPTKKISSVSISNGLAWNIEDNIFYYIDSPTRQIAAYDYNPHTGEISKKSWYILL